MRLVETLARRGYEWAPQPNQNPTHPIVAAVRDDSVIFVSGQVPIEDGKVLAGKVSTGNLQEARHAAELCALQCLYAAGSVINPEEILGVSKLTVFVNCKPGFNQTSAVANGASEFLLAVFGDAGKHARSAVGVAELPMDAMVEIEAVFKVR